ncbi:MAG: hypothetical protein ACRC68_19270 [Clostridium sp.]
MKDNDTILENIFSNDDEFQDFEFFPLSHEENNRIQNPQSGFNQNFQPPKFPGGNFPGGNFPGGFPPNNNFPGGSNLGANVSPANLGSPPNYIPSKNDGSVKSLNSNAPGTDNFGNPTLKSVSQNSIRFCLYQFTYIWERNGRAYWAFLLNVDRVSVSGLRWFSNRWVYFGVGLRRIDSFICYRNTCEICNNSNLYRNGDDNTFTSSRKLYTNSEIRQSISKTLVSLDIPELKDDYLIQPIGIVDGENVESTIPCVKYRNTHYSINLEITYPETIDKNIKNKITQYANESSIETVKIINAVRGSDDSLNPLESFDACTKVISKALASFSSEFNSKLRDPEIDKDISREITHSITENKVTDNWKTKI